MAWSKLLALILTWEMYGIGFRVCILNDAASWHQLHAINRNRKCVIQPQCNNRTCDLFGVQYFCDSEADV